MDNYIGWPGPGASPAGVTGNVIGACVPLNNAPER